MISREEIDQICTIVRARYEVDSIYLYGSHAKGTATAESDVDILVMTPHGTRPNRFDMNLNRDLSEAIGKKCNAVFATIPNEWMHTKIFP